MSDQDLPDDISPPMEPAGDEPLQPPAAPPADVTPPAPEAIPPAPAPMAIPPAAVPSTPAPIDPLTPADEKNYAMAAHLSGIIIPLIGPVLVLMLNKSRSEFVDQQSKEALNFQITAVAGLLISGILMLVIVGFCTFFVVWLGMIIFPILAAVEVNNGRAYRYPITLRLVH